MNNVLIHPNWHVVLIHLPLGLLAAGILIELFSFLWKRSSVRMAGRWMILLGALGTLPAMTTGVYALYDVVHQSGGASAAGWQELVKASHWGPEHWFHMRMHIWLMSCAAGLFLLGALAWAGCSNAARQSLRWPMLLLMLVALAGTVAGGWFGQEAVYVLGVGAEPRTTAAAMPTTNPFSMPIKVDPVQVHLLFIGLALFVATGAAAMTLRRWADESALGEALLSLKPQATESDTAPAGEIVAPLFPARFWLVAAILSLLAGAAGLWTTEGLHWWLPETRALFQKAITGVGRQELTADQTRLLLHVLLALVIVILPLIAAMVTRFSRRLKWLTAICMLLLATAVGGQVWTGAQMLFGL